MKKIKGFLSALMVEFLEGLFGEYLLMGIAAAIIGVLGSFGLTGGGTDQEQLAFWFMMVVAIILGLIGFIKTLKNFGHDSKLSALLVHVIVFGVVYLLTQFFVPVIIALVALYFFLKLIMSGAVYVDCSGAAPRVWRKNFFTKEELTVDPAGTCYYDPKDDSWHDID